MSLDDISHSQPRGDLLSITKLEIFLERRISSGGDKVCSGVLVDTVDDGRLEDVDVVRSDSVGKRENFCDVFGNGDLRA